MLGHVHTGAWLWLSGDDQRRGRSDQMSDQKKSGDALHARLAPLLPPSNHLKISHCRVLNARHYVL